MAQRWSDSAKQRIDKAGVPDGRLVEAIESVSQRPKVLVSAAIGIYGPTPKKTPIDERPSPGHFLAGVCKRWESAALRAENAHARFATLWRRARQRRWCARADAPAQAFVGSPIGQVPLPTAGGALPAFHAPLGLTTSSWVHRDDVVVWRSKPSTIRLDGPVNCTAPNPITQRELDTIASVASKFAFGLPEPIALGFGDGGHPRRRTKHLPAARG